MAAELGRPHPAHLSACTSPWLTWRRNIPTVRSAPQPGRCWREGTHAVPSPRAPTQELEDQAGRETVTFAHWMREPPGVPPTLRFQDAVRALTTSKLPFSLGWSAVPLATLLPKKTAGSLSHAQLSSGFTRTPKTGAFKTQSTESKELNQ